LGKSASVAFRQVAVTSPRDIFDRLRVLHFRRPYPDPPMPLRPLHHAEYRTRAYAPELDGLRAIAVLLVLTCHVQGQAFVALSGYLGVTVFFVLSGYLITTLALREEEERGRLSLLAFSVRRTFRIFPLYYVVLGLYVAVLFGTGVRPTQAAFLQEHWAEYVFYFQEVAYSAGGDMPFTQSWSLGIEEKFYLVWPLVAFGLLRSAPRLRLPVAGLLLVLFGTVPWTIEPPGYPRISHALIPYSQILAGCALALWLHDPAGFAVFRRIRQRVGSFGIAGTCLVAHLAMATMVTAGYGGGWNLAYLFTATLLVGEIVAADTPVRRALQWKPLAGIGRLSYGVYLIHFFPLFAAQRVAEHLPWAGARPIVAFGLTAVGSVGVAYLLSIAVERPFIRIGRRLSARCMNRANASGDLAS
jgi:peptidoglycan/LPS O-acetylase OafA/YrhL